MSLLRPGSLFLCLLPLTVLMSSCEEPVDYEQQEREGLARAIAETKAEWPERDLSTVKGRLIGQWRASEVGNYGHQNVYWFATDGTCAFQTVWQGRPEATEPPSIGTYEIVGQEGDRIDFVLTWPDREAFEGRTVNSYEIDEIARWAQANYETTTDGKVKKGKPWEMDYVGTNQRPPQKAN